MVSFSNLITFLPNKWAVPWLEWLSFNCSAYLLVLSNMNLTVIVLQRLKDQLNKRGATTIRGLGRAFRTIDSFDGNRKVDAQEFFTGLQEFGVQITKVEADVGVSDLLTGSDAIL